jgi:hypothetical protein
MNTSLEIENRRLENRLRGRARTRGYTLRKCRSRSPEHPSFGTYCLVDDHCVLTVGDRDTGWGASLEEIAEFLS